MPSKAQGLSLNTIIIAAIVLIVLLILVGLTTGYFSNKWKPAFGRLTETSCKGGGGTVVAESGYCPSLYKEKTGIFDDVNENQKCCVPWSCEEMYGRCETRCGEGYSEEPNYPCDGNKKCCRRSSSNEEEG